MAWQLMKLILIGLGLISSDCHLIFPYRSGSSQSSDGSLISDRPITPINDQARPDNDLGQGMPCEPRTTTCEKNALITCDEQGHVKEKLQCAHGCNPTLQECYQCNPGTGGCQGNSEVSCSQDGKIIATKECGICAICVDPWGCQTAIAGTDPGNDCDPVGCGTGNCKGGTPECGWQTSGEGNCPACMTCEGAISTSCVKMADKIPDKQGANLCHGTCQVCQSGACSYADATAYCPYEGFDNGAKNYHCSGTDTLCLCDPSASTLTPDGQDNDCDGTKDEMEVLAQGVLVKDCKTPTITGASIAKKVASEACQSWCLEQGYTNCYVNCTNPFIHPGGWNSFTVFSFDNCQEANNLQQDAGTEACFYAPTDPYNPKSHPDDRIRCLGDKVEYR